MSKYKAEREQLTAELRAIKAGIDTGSIKPADAKKQYEAYRTKKLDLEKREAVEKAPLEKRSVSYADVATAMREKRAVTLSGTGAINQVNELIKVLQAKTPILKKVRIFKGANASTNIPVWNPSVATPASYAEGATAVGDDTQGALGSTSITPYAYVSLLPISAEAIQMGSVDIESELDGIFGDAFARAFESQILTGDGTGRNATGLFPSIPSANKISAGVAGAPKISDLAKLALSIQDYSDTSVIVMHKAIYQAILADSTAGEDVKLYKESLIRDKSIEGVKVEFSPAAPSAITAGSVVAVAGDLNTYAWAMASEIVIEPKKKPGDTNTYFEAMVFANGKPILTANFYGLVTV